MISRHEIIAASITQDNDAKCNGHKYLLLTRNIHRNANKKRRQYLNKELRKECDELGFIPHC